MERREFIRHAAVGSLCMGYEISHALDINSAIGLATQAATVAKTYMMGEKEEIQIGESHYKANIEKSGGLYPDDNVQKVIQLFAQPLISTSERKNLPWEIVVIKSDEVNAWAMPGGKIAVNSALIKQTRNEEELASVIAHEIGHVEKSHSIEQIQHQALMQGAGGALKTALSAFDSSGMTTEVLSSLEAPIYQMILSGYSRKNEFEADAHILHVFEKVGLDSTKADDFFVTLDTLYPSDSQETTSLFSTHPVTKERIETIRELAQKREYKLKNSNYPGWKELKSRIG